MAKATKKRKKSSNRKRTSGGGGTGGVMMSMRGGFKKAAHSAVGAGGKSKKPQTPLGKTLNWGLTVILLAVAVYLLLRRLGYVG